MSDMTEKIHVRRTVVIEYDVPFNSAYFPEMSLEEAKQHEQDLPPGEVLEIIEGYDGENTKFAVEVS